MTAEVTTEQLQAQVKELRDALRNLLMLYGEKPIDPWRFKELMTFHQADHYNLAPHPRDVLKALDLVYPEQKGDYLRYPSEEDAENLDTCRGCGAQIVWRRMRSGRWAMHDLDQEPHWSSCSQYWRYKEFRDRLEEPSEPNR
jgi:hypothetical protein